MKIYKYFLSDILDLQNIYSTYSVFNDLAYYETFLNTEGGEPLQLLTQLYKTQDTEKRIPQIIADALKAERREDAAAVLTTLEMEIDNGKAISCHIKTDITEKNGAQYTALDLKLDTRQGAQRSEDIITPLLDNLKAMEISGVILDNDGILEKELIEQSKNINFKSYLNHVKALNFELWKIVTDNATFKGMLEGTTKGLPRELLLPEVKTAGYLDHGERIMLLTGKEFTAPGKAHYTDADLRAGVKEIELKVGENKQDKTELISKVTITTTKELLPIHNDLFSIYYTLRELNPDSPIFLIDMVNALHPREGGSKFTPRDKFAKEIFKEIEHAISVKERYDLSQVMNYYCSIGNKDWQALKEAGYDPFFTANFIPADIAPLKMPNGKTGQALIPHEKDLSRDKVYLYAKTTKQIKSLTGDIRYSPLRAGIENDPLFFEILKKVMNMPFYQNGEKYLAARQRALEEIEKLKADTEEKKKAVKDEFAEELKKLKATSEYKNARPAERKDQESDLKAEEKKELKEIQKEYKEAYKKIMDPLKERERTAPRDSCSIKAKSLIESLKLTKRPYYIVDDINTVLANLKKRGYIKSYTATNPTKKHIEETKFNIKFF